MEVPRGNMTRALKKPVGGRPAQAVPRPKRPSRSRRYTQESEKPAEQEDPLKPIDPEPTTDPVELSEATPEEPFTSVGLVPVVGRRLRVERILPALPALPATRSVSPPPEPTPIMPPEARAEQDPVSSGAARLAATKRIRTRCRPDTQLLTDPEKCTKPTGPLRALQELVRLSPERGLTLRYTVQVPMVRRQIGKVYRQVATYPAKDFGDYSLDDALDTLRIFTQRWTECGLFPPPDATPVLVVQSRPLGSAGGTPPRTPETLQLQATLWELDPWHLIVCRENGNIIRGPAERASGRLRLDEQEPTEEALDPEEG